MFNHLKRALVFGGIVFTSMTTGSLLPDPFNFIVPFSIIISCVVWFISFFANLDIDNER